MHGPVERLPTSPGTLGPTHLGWLTSFDSEVFGIGRCIVRHNERLSAIAVMQVKVNNDGTVNVMLEVAYEGQRILTTMYAPCRAPTTTLFT